MRTVLVTGATGNVGSRVVRELGRRGVSVRAFVRDQSKGARMLGAGVELVVGDFSDTASVARAVRGADAVFLASPNAPRQVEHEVTVIDAAANAGVGQIVKLSTVGAEIGSPLAFWDGHGRIERHLEQSRVSAVV